ncbi:MAG: HipA-like protein, partial [Chloroflexota bacterium]
MPFPVIEVPSASIERTEQLGSKEKFWFRGPEGARFLFKYARENTGEAFSEKVAAEVALLLHLPHAQIEFARYQGIIGTASRNFVAEGQQSLIHGNELLSQVVKGYEKERWQKNSEHTFERIRRVFAEFHSGTLVVPRNWEPPFSGMTPTKVLAGYLVFDALIGNVDRHHENWGVLENIRSESGERVFEVAPTFDHASSLGRELLEDGKRRVLEPAGGMGRYLWN